MDRAAAKGEEIGRDGLLRELAEARADLEDLEALRRGFLGQTGVHIGMRVLQSVRHQFEQEEVRLKERIAHLRKHLEGQG